MVDQFRKACSVNHWSGGLTTQRPLILEVGTSKPSLFWVLRPIWHSGVETRARREPMRNSDLTTRWTVQGVRGSRPGISGWGGSRCRYGYLNAVPTLAGSRYDEHGHVP